MKEYVRSSDDLFSVCNTSFAHPWNEFTWDFPPSQAQSALELRHFSASRVEEFACSQMSLCFERR